MPATGEIRDISEIQEAKLEWIIQDFLLLSGDVFVSSEIVCSGISWILAIYPNGTKTTQGFVTVALGARLTDIPESLEFSFSLKTFDGTTVSDSVFKKNFVTIQNTKLAAACLILRSELIKRKYDLLPWNALTVICTLRTKANGKEDSKNVAQAGCVDAFAQTDEGTGIWKLQEHLQRIFLNGNVSDVVLKVGDQEVKSHRCILAARSPVFQAMLTHETKEKNTGVVDIPDVDANTFTDLLSYLYTGSMANVTPQNVVKLYTAADKYQVDELKEVCLDYMLKNISIESFCDFLSLALQYVEKDLTLACSQFFVENVLDIILTSKWQIFMSENPIACNELHIKHNKYLQLNK